MRTRNTRVFAAMTAGAVLAALGSVAASAPGTGRAERAAAVLPRGTAHAPAPGAQLWLRRYHGPGGASAACAVAASPDGKTVFVTGYSERATAGWAFATVAYNAATGTQLWVKRHNGPDNCPAPMAVSPTGKQVFVTGFSTTGGPGTNYTTIAYNAATGAQQWVHPYYGPGNNWARAYAVAVSPTGRTVYVTGSSTGPTSRVDYATVAYNAATGAQLWVKRFNGRDTIADGGTSVAVSPGGGRVYVTGFTLSHSSGDDYVTIAYNAATGAQLWIKRFDGPANITSGARSLVVSPPGGRVLVTMVTGDPEGAIPGNNYVTVAYSAATGARLWVKRYNGPGDSWDDAKSMAVTPSGGTLFVTGESVGTSAMDYATVAYDPATGARLWVARYNGPTNEPDAATSVAVSPTGETVYVTGNSTGSESGWDYATVAYNAATGAQLWTKRHNAPSLFDNAQSVAVSPTGNRVFITGSVAGDYVTIAYGG